MLKRLRQRKPAAAVSVAPAVVVVVVAVVASVAAVAAIVAAYAVAIGRRQTPTAASLKSQGASSPLSRRQLTRKMLIMLMKTAWEKNFGTILKSKMIDDTTENSKRLVDSKDVHPD